MNTEHSYQYVNAHSSSGKGPLYIVVCEERGYFEFASRVERGLEERFSVLPIRLRTSSKLHCNEVVREFERVLKDSGKRQFRFLVFGHACSYLFALALKNKKLFRSLVIVDGEVCTDGSVFTRMIELIERSLPLGLPFRLKEKGFSAMPFLQRMRFPTLVVSSDRASDRRQHEAEVLNALLPISWMIHDLDSVDELIQEVERFESVPLKRPQKNRDQEKVAL